MSNKIGLILKLDGENQYTKALQNIKKETKLFQTELKNLDQAFSGNRNSMEALQKRQEVLERQQESYSRQVKSAKEGLENARREYDKQSAALDDLREKLDKAEAELKQMEEAGDTSSEAYRKQKETVDQLRQAVDKQSENLLTASGRVTDWNQRLLQAEGGLDACNKELTKNEQYLDEAARSADGCATSIDGMGKEVTDTSGDMDKLADEADDAAESLDKAGDEAEGLGLSFKDGLMMAAADMAMNALQELGQKAVEAAKYVLDVGSSFEAQMSKVSAISGSTASQMAKLTAKAQEMGRKTKFSATESGEAMEYMAMAGWKTGDMLDGIEGIMNLAAAAGEDLGTTSDIVTDALTAFGQSAKESGRLADIMAAASSNANTNVSMMGETFKYAAPIAGALGYKMEDTALAVGLMANAGIKASQAGTSLRSGLTRMAAPTKQAAEAMDKYGISLTDSDGKMLSFHDLMVQLREKLGGLSETEQTAAANAIFGKNAMSGWLAVLNASDEDFDKLAVAIDNSNGSAERMAETMQDNLSGKLTILGSATEGLGIALYNYVSGPLQNVVEFATDVINGITDAITPQKTEIQEFSEEIAATNKELESMVSQAGRTVENAELEVGKLKDYEEFITDVVDKCNEFNQIDLGGGKYQIVNSAGEIVSEGFGAIDDALANTAEGLGNFGTDGINTAQIEGDTAIIRSYFNAAGKQIRATSKRAQKFGDDGVTTKTFKEGTDTIIQYFDDTGKKIGETRDTIVELADYDYHGIANGIGYVSDAENNVITVTDEFTKRKIDQIVNNLSDALPELADRWDSVHGTLQASNDELERWFGNQQALAMQDAITKATSELYEAQAQAILNLVKAESQANHLLDQYNEAYGTSLTDIKDAWEELNLLLANTGSVGGLEDWELYNNIKAAIENIDAANGVVSETDTQIGELQESLDGLAEMYGISADEAEEWGHRNDDAALTAEEAAENVSNLADETGDAADGVDELTDAENDLTEAMQDAITDGLEAQAKAFESLLEKYKEFKKEISDQTREKINLFEPFEYAKGSEDEAPVPMQEMIDNLNKTKESLIRWKEDMKILAGEVGNTISAEFYEYILAQGPDFGIQLQEMIGDLNTTGGEQLRQLSDAWTGAMDMSEGVSVALANTKLAIEAGLHSLGSTDIDFSELRNSISSAATYAVTGWEDLEDGTVDALQKTVDIAQSMGIQIPDKLAESIRTGKTGPESAMAQLEGAITGTMDAMIQIAETNGVEIPTSLRDGINNGTVDVVDAYNSIVTSLGQESGAFNAVGSDSASELAAGITDGTGDVEEAGKGVVKDSATAASAAAAQFDASGQIAPQKFALGMNSKASYATDKADEIASDSATAAGNHGGEFEASGSDSAQSYSDGIERSSGDAQRAAADMAASAVDETSGYVNAMHTNGWNTAIGFAQGMIDGTSEVVSAARYMANEAVNAAKAALQIRSPSRRAREEIAGNYNKGLTLGLSDGAQEIVNGFVAPINEGVARGEAIISAASRRNILSGFYAGTSDSNYRTPEVLPGNVGTSSRDLLRYLNRADTSNMVSAASSITANDLMKITGVITDAGEAIKELTDTINDWIDTAESSQRAAAQGMADAFSSQIAEISQRGINLRSKRLAMSMGR